MPCAIRVTQIEIDTARPSQDNWIRAHIQELEIDNDGSVGVERIASREIYRRMSGSILGELHTFPDPHTGELMTLSVAQIAVGIKAAMIKWVTEDFDANFDAESGWIYLNDADK
jgi:hypothetical protein